MIYMVLGLYVVIAFVTDARKSTIPNFLTAVGCITGLFLQGMMAGWDGVGRALIGMAAGFGLMLPLYVFKAIGAGDVKLFAGIGSLTSMPFVIDSMIYSVLFAGVIGFGLLIWRKELGKAIVFIFRRTWCMMLLRDFRVLTEPNQTGSVTFPFMYAVVPAVLVSLTETVI